MQAISSLFRVTHLLRRYLKSHSLCVHEMAGNGRGRMSSYKKAINVRSNLSLKRNESLTVLCDELKTANVKTNAIWRLCAAAFMFKNLQALNLRKLICRDCIEWWSVLSSLKFRIYTKLGRWTILVVLFLNLTVFEYYTYGGKCKMLCGKCH